jgi:hypothetical protein
VLCGILLPKTIWSLFERNICDDGFFYTLLALNYIKPDAIPISHYVKGILYKSVLFRRLLLKDDVDWLSDETA